MCNEIKCDCDFESLTVITNIVKGAVHSLRIAPKIFLVGGILKTNIYRVDINKYIFAIFEISKYLQTHDISFLNLKIKKHVNKYKFEKIFPEDDFFLSQEKIERLLRFVGNAFFEKKQKYYYSKFTDILSIFIACSSIETNKKDLYEFIENNLSENLHEDYLSIFSDLCSNKYPIYKNEVNKINFYMRRKINSKHKKGEKKHV